MSTKKTEECPVTMLGLILANVLLLPGEVGFIALLMLCGDSSVSDGTIHWDILAVVTTVFFTINCVVVTLASGEKENKR